MLVAAAGILAAPHRGAFDMLSAGAEPGHSAWSVGANMSCSECQRVVSNLEGYCAKQRPMGDLDLTCFDCTWAHHEMPGCQRIMALVKARPQPFAESSVRFANKGREAWRCPGAEPPASPRAHPEPPFRGPMRRATAA